MNPETGGSSDPVLGHVPRKKLPPVPHALTAATTTPNNATAGVRIAPLLSAPIPRRTDLPLPARSHPHPTPAYYRPSHTDSYPPSHDRVRIKKKPQRIGPPAVQIIREDPLIVKVRLAGVPLTEGIPRHRASLRAPKRSRPAYQELADTDDDDFLTEEEMILPPKKVEAADGTVVAPEVHPIDAPPPGVLHTLWYSREVFLNVFVLEKICGWKSRARLELIDPEGTVVTLTRPEAASYQQKALQDVAFWKDPRARTEVSRIRPTACPVVLAMAAQVEAAKAAQATASQLPATDGIRLPPIVPKYRLRTAPDNAREELLLVKWRGRSYLHCAWERPVDVQNAEHNVTARNKIKRFYQAQELAFGPSWKQVLEEERATAAKIHAHGQSAGIEEDPEADQGEEHFAPQCLEVERILACDENDMNLQVLAKQRALNLRAEQDDLRRKETENQKSTASDTVGAEDSTPVAKVNKLVGGLIDVANMEPAWDPEDNVRYVVKWKALPYAEITWEYWRDIKQDAVDQAEDFWYRQRPPDLDQVRALESRPHPHIRDFRKLQETPVFGISSRDRPVANLGDDTISQSNNDDDDGDTFKGFHLRSYQLEGVNWLLFNWWNKRSCILADEMGLGKTIQSAAFLRGLQSLPATQVQGPFLIVAPLSLVNQWQSELRSWAPDMNVVLYHGSADARDFLVQQEFYYTDQFVPKPTAVKLKKLNVTKFSVLITTYEVALKDVAVISKIRWRVLIVDEAHRLKNSKARLFEELAMVPREHCVLLTGTPIANATEELWALLHFANPSVFDDKDSFLEKFGEMTDAAQVNELHNLLKPYLLRRVKEDVEKSLPPKEETILEVSLTPIQKTFYKAIYERNTSFLFKGTKPSNAPSLMNVMMELRKCCNHPYLVKGAEDRILNEAAAKVQKMIDKNGNEVPIDYGSLFGEQLVKSSGKMVLMEKLLQKLFDGGHKVLVFSQMVRVLDLLEELLKLKRYKYERLDGSTTSSARLSAVDRFNRKSCQRFVMLLSTRAGGLGLNLTAADIVIIFDSDWNPQNDLQAMARAHRIGQTRAVRVYRLLTAKTYEMHMFHSASLKLGLERAVLSQNREQNDESDENKSKRVSDREAQAKQIDELLKKGAYDVFRDEDDAEAEKFMETDIDQLLEHKSKKVTYGTSATSSLGSGLGSFSKASFVADTAEGDKDVDLDDPDFWSKAVGLEAPEEMPEDVAAMIDDGIKRSRKQVQVYDPYAETAEAEQRKKDRIAMEKMLEKEEKDRERIEKQIKKKEYKEKKKRERELQKVQQPTEKPLSSNPKIVKAKVEPIKAVVEHKPKKSKKNERQQALRRAQNEDPALERLKQAWEGPQRNRATAASMRFGFGRFCKIRSESNLTSLPLQDLEVFTRSWLYQLALQVCVALLSKLEDGASGDSIRATLQEWLGLYNRRELDWLCESVSSVMSIHLDVEARQKFLRMPVILAEPSYLADLRQGGAFRAFRRMGILARFNRVIEECLDSILSALGHQELGKRGCATSDLSTLDADLKARFVTTEELALAIGSIFTSLKFKAPASWWDRRCDVALIIGTFVHGMGNYESMRNDPDLPFSDKIKKTAQRDEACKAANQTFRSAATAARKAFDDALEAARVKAELEVQAAVAAAAKAAQKREADAELLRKGGAAAEAVISSMPDTQVENAFEFDGTDSHFVTLPRMQRYLQDSVRKAEVSSMVSAEAKAITDTVKNGTSAKEDHDELSGKAREDRYLPMPDARVLDHRFLLVLEAIEEHFYDDDTDKMDVDEANPDLWLKSDDVLTNLQIRTQTLSIFAGAAVVDFMSEYSGVGLGGNQCGTSHRSLNDGTDFGFGSASSELAQVAYGTDAPRFLRALGVPMNITRYAISGLVYAEPSCVEKLLQTETLRYFGDASSGVPLTSTVEGILSPKAATLGESEDQQDSKETSSKSAKPHTNMNTPLTGEQNGDNYSESSPCISGKTDSKESVHNGTALVVPNDGENSNLTIRPSQDISLPGSKPNTETSANTRLSDAGEITSTMLDTLDKDLTLQKECTVETKQLQEKMEIKENELAEGNVMIDLLHATGEEAKPSLPIDPVELITDAFRENAKLRAATCLAVLMFGFPTIEGMETFVDDVLWKTVLTSSGTQTSPPPLSLFTIEAFRRALVSLAPDVEIPSCETLKTYVDSILLPHCLRLCIYGNGPVTRNARGSEGKYETAFGVSLYPEPSQAHPSPLPDPCLSLHEHSMEALGQASALLRRVRLLRSSQFICRGESISVAALVSVTRSSFMRALEGMPVWWCPWIHDLALLVEAATGGLFSVVPTRGEHFIFSPEAIQRFQASSILGGRKGVCPAKFTPSDQTRWIERQSHQFPTLNQLERRLAFLCSQATTDVDSDDRYDNLPMFDHGGWPRN